MTQEEKDFNKKKISYCALDDKGMGYNFDDCLYPDRLCTNCLHKILNGREIK